MCRLISDVATEKPPEGDDFGVLAYQHLVNLATIKFVIDSFSSAFVLSNCTYFWQKEAPATLLGKIFARDREFSEKSLAQKKDLITKAI